MRHLFVAAGILLALTAYAIDEVETSIVDSHKNIRAFHFVLRKVSLERAYWMVDRAHDAGFNTIIVAVADGVKLQNAPWKVLPDAWSKNEFEEWSAYVRKLDMEIVPELHLLTHQEKFFQSNYPELMFNLSTYDPTFDKVYALVVALIDEVLDITHAKRFHIGHDEVAGHNKQSANKWLRRNEQMLPPEMFYMDIVKLHSHLKKRKIETWMWGDMLISPDEFPSMKTDILNGRMHGYGKSIRDKIPKDIVICDWHYGDEQHDFPSLSEFKIEGFRVIGVTWRREKTIENFSSYAAAHGADGMIATSWFEVQRGNWKAVDKIITTSGKYFNKDFPND